jgi:Bacterial archaeo-eukaryotic release factor family 3
MLPIAGDQLKLVMDAVHYRPAVSVILPFHTKSNLNAEFKQSLKFSLDEAERKLSADYPKELAAIVMRKLHHLSDGLLVNTSKKGVALFASPVFEKLIYLDVEVESKIVIDESFEIRDLVYNRNESQLHYLLLLVSGEECRLFLGNHQHLLPVKIQVPSTLADYRHDAPQRVANFSDPGAFKEILVEKFLRGVDKELTDLLHEHHLPVFVTGSTPILGLFRTVTHNAKAITKYIEGNYIERNTHQLQQLIQPHLEEWKRQIQIQLLRQIETAANQKKLSAGIEQVWQSIYDKNARLLVVEKEFMVSCEQVQNGKVVFNERTSEPGFSRTHDAVDDAIEAILKNGGDVAFVEKGLLTPYEHIALIQFFSQTSTAPMLH